MTTNVFNVLGHGGFLRDQGILCLESVQMFYKKIEQEPSPASMIITNLLDICDEPGYHELYYQPVIRLTGHAVVVHSYTRGGDYLVLLTIDSASPTGYRFVFCSIQQQRLQIRQFQNLLCLASDKCYLICFA